MEDQIENCVVLLWNMRCLLACDCWVIRFNASRLLLRQNLGWDFSFGHTYHCGRLQWITPSNPHLTPSSLVFRNNMTAKASTHSSCCTFLLFWHKLAKKTNYFMDVSSVPSHAGTKTPSTPNANANPIWLCHFGDPWRAKGSSKLLLS